MDNYDPMKALSTVNKLHGEMCAANITPALSETIIKQINEFSLKEQPKGNQQASVIGTMPTLARYLLANDYFLAKMDIQFCQSVGLTHISCTDTQTQIQSVGNTTIDLLMEHYATITQVFDAVVKLRFELAQIHHFYKASQRNAAIWKSVFPIRENVWSAYHQLDWAQVIGQTIAHAIYQYEDPRQVLETVEALHKHAVRCRLWMEGIIRHKEGFLTDAEKIQVFNLFRIRMQRYVERIHKAHCLLDSAEAMFIQTMVKTWKHLIYQDSNKRLTERQVHLLKSVYLQMVEECLPNFPEHISKKLAGTLTFAKMLSFEATELVDREERMTMGHLSQGIEVNVQIKVKNELDENLKANVIEYMKTKLSKFEKTIVDPKLVELATVERFENQFTPEERKALMNLYKNK